MLPPLRPIVAVVLLTPLCTVVVVVVAVVVLSGRGDVVASDIVGAAKTGGKDGVLVLFL